MLTNNYSGMNSNEVNTQKKEIRKHIKALKSFRSPNDGVVASEEIFSTVENLPQFIIAQTVMLYWSLPDEVQTHSFVKKWYTSKRIVLPLVVENHLELRVFSGTSCLVETPPFGILEPQLGMPVSINEVDLVIVPGVAFDLKGNRMGRGKGYYDRLLAGRSVYKVGVCFNFQLVESVPTDEYDIKMDKIIYA
jgi:5-formyltetrahydrofolate cyclo-ligase